MSQTTVTSPAGELSTRTNPGRVWRVGYRPNPWAWTPWHYTDHSGRFNGRWDDPHGTFRTLYTARELLACLLEILAPFRPDPRLEPGFAGIDQDPAYPSQPPATVPVGWLKHREANQADLSGTYCAVTAAASISTLRSVFLSDALQCGLADLDAGSLQLSAPRALTQHIASWVYDLHDGLVPLVDGVQFESRDGDGLTLWAIFERDHDTAVPAHITDIQTVALNRTDPTIAEAFRLHHLTWAASDTPSPEAENP